MAGALLRGRLVLGKPCKPSIHLRSYTKRVPRAVQKEPPSKLAGAIFLLAPVSTFCLGVWQYRRRQWKIDKIAELDERVRRAEPVQLSLGECSGVEYQRVTARGEFDYTTQVSIGPRSFIDSTGGSGGGGVISLSRPGDTSRVGHHIITAFTLASGERVLVNRGWRPQLGRGEAASSAGQLPGERSIGGVLRLTEETSTMVPPNKVDTLSWHSRDVAALATKLDTLPVFIDLDLESSMEASSKGGPIGGQTRISLSNDHVQYMLTWWGMSLLTSILWLQRFVL